jgi:hypothetical protein
MSIIFGYIYLLLLKWVAEPLMFVSMFGTIAGFAGLSWYLYANAESLGATVHDSASGQVTSATGDLSEHAEKSAMAGAVVCACLSVFALVCSICCCSRVRTAAACCEVACDAIFAIPSLLILPLAKALLKGVIWIVCLYGFMLLITTGTPTGGMGGVARSFDFNDEQKLMIAFYIFATYWMLCFTEALYQFVVAYVVQDWYYTPYNMNHEKDVECCAVMDGVKLGLFKNCGTLAYGSALIAILWWIETMLTYLQKKNEETANSQVIACILACVQCCVSCCKDIIEFINKNAYIACAVNGTNFCNSVTKAMQIIVEVGVVMTILNGATVLFTIFGSLFITGMTGLVVYLTIDNMGGHIDQADGGIALLGSSCAVALGVSLCFMHVFDMTSDTLVFCYGNDHLTNANAAQYAPEPLAELFDVAQNQAGENQSKRQGNY